jgi:hypothetical protein
MAQSDDGTQPELLSDIPDLSGTSLKAFRANKSPSLHQSAELIKERVGQVIITASGSAGAKRVE